MRLGGRIAAFFAVSVVVDVATLQPFGHFLYGHPPWATKNGTLFNCCAESLHFYGTLAHLEAESLHFYGTLSHLEAESLHFYGTLAHLDQNLCISRVL